MIQLRHQSAGHEVAMTGERGPDWWHRDHPVFTPLCGFFSGLAFMLVVPSLFAGLLETFFAQHTVSDLFPLVLVALLVPVVLVARGRSRRFGLYFVLGMVATAVVVLGVAALVVWMMTATA
ncbi:hypothetical protein JCM18899A_18440 [Nocardioides sp. AN3]